MTGPSPYRRLLVASNTRASAARTADGNRYMTLGAAGADGSPWVLRHRRLRQLLLGVPDGCGALTQPRHSAAAEHRHLRLHRARPTPAGRLTRRRRPGIDRQRPRPGHPGPAYPRVTSPE